MGAAAAVAAGPSSAGGRAGWLCLCSPHLLSSPGPMAPRLLGPLVLALGGAAAVLGSVLFILWKTYFGSGREKRWDQGEAWCGAESARLPQWDEWDVSAGPGSAEGLGGPGSASLHVWPRGVSAALP